MAVPGLIDYRNAIMVTKDNLLCTDDPEVLKGFDPFMIRRCLAQSQDTLVVAQQMNKLHASSPWMQWNLAFHTVPARKRYDKWSKKGEMNPDLKLISEYFYISLEKASEYLGFLSPEVIEEIRQKVKNCESNEKAKPRKAK